MLRCKVDDKQEIAKTVRSLGWEIGTRPHIVIDMTGYPESTVEQLSETIKSKNIENLSIKTGKFGDILLRFEAAQLEQVKALVEKIKLNGEPVHYTIEE